MGLLTDPFTFVNADDAEAADLNNRFSTLYNEINGSLSNANISSTAAIAETKLNLTHTTVDLQQRIGVSVRKDSGMQRVALLRPRKINTINIGLPVTTSFLLPSRGAATPFSSNAWGLEFDRTLNQLWMTDSTNAEVYRVNTATSGILSSFDVTALTPRDITTDGTNLWMVSDANNMIYRMNTLGTILSSFATAGATPTGITFLNSFIYYAETDNDQVYRVNTLGTTLSQFASPNGSSGQNSGGLTNNGIDLFLTDTASNQIFKLNTLGTILASFMTPTQTEVPTSIATHSARGITHDGSHLWIIDDTGAATHQALMIRCAIGGFTRAPVVRIFQADSGGTPNIAANGVLFTDQDYTVYYHDNLNAVNTNIRYDVPNSANNAIAFKRRGTTRSVDDLYYMGGDRVLRYRRGTFVSSFSLNGVTTLQDMCFGDGYLWILNDVATPDNIIYQVTSAIYDTDGLNAAAASSFNIDAAAGYSNTAVGIAYDDDDPKRHSLWICETGARNVANIATNALTLIQSFTAPAAIAPPQSLVLVGQDLWILEGNTGGATAQLFRMNTAGTVLDSYALPGVGNPDFQGIDFDGQTLWISGNDDGAGAQDDYVATAFSYLQIFAEDMN